MDDVSRRLARVVAYAVAMILLEATIVVYIAGAKGDLKSDGNLAEARGEYQERKP